MAVFACGLCGLQHVPRRVTLTPVKRRPGSAHRITPGIAVGFPRATETGEPGRRAPGLAASDSCVHTVHTQSTQLGRVGDTLFLSAADPRPMYQQIVDQVTARVAAGDWTAGHALPSIRELAAESGVSVITVKRAYEELERAGVIATRHGKGSVVTGPSQRARGLIEASLAQHLGEVVLLGQQLGLDRDALHERLDRALAAPRPAGHRKGTPA